MNIPKIKFRKMSLKENIDLVKWAYFEDSGSLDVHTYTIQYFPELADISNELPKENIYKIIEEVVTKKYEKYNKRMLEEAERYNNLWKNNNDIYFSKLSEFLEVEWPDDKKTIDAAVGVVPVFPRYLDEFSFSVGTGLQDWKLIETCAHETLHFLWFEKWKKISPETPRREYDSPYIVWEYSEMVTDPILNNKPFSEIFDFKERGYDSFYEIEDNGELLMDKLRKIYAENISINEKIDIGFNLIKNNKEKH